MPKKLIVPVILFLFVALTLMTLPVAAKPQQPQLYYYTPTADSNGRVVYIVKENDSCLSISLLTGVSIDDLKILNKLDENCSIYQGQELLLGIVQESTATPGPSPTPTPMLPSPTPFKGYAKVCITLYEDTNGNAMKDGSETTLAGGAASISDALGKFSKTSELAAEDNTACFEEVPEGEYTISIAIPEGYNPTTEMTYLLKAKAGDEMIVNFGAQPNAAIPTPIAEDEGGSKRSPMLAIAGGLMLLGGAGLAIYFWLARRNSSGVP